MFSHVLLIVLHVVSIERTRDKVALNVAWLDRQYHVAFVERL